ncbi:MAG: protein kinase [Dechloromonas sp.]|nr:MAG: protein kinase [Dechloromonas sp.]
MKPWHNKNDCEHLRAYHAYYPVPAAAMLWCGVPPDDAQEELNRISPHPHIRGVFTHPFIPCFEVRCRIIHDAIESRTLPASRENGKVTDEHIAPERRHVSREHLKAWIAKEHPADKPAFLFDEIERKTHAAINADAFRALQADRDALKARIDKAEVWAKTIIAEKNALLGERDSLRAMVDKANAPGGRSEKTYLNIIGGLLALMLGKSPAGKPQSSFENQGAIISAMLGHYGHVKGMGDSNLEKIMADANKTLKDSAISGG